MHGETHSLFHSLSKPRANRNRQQDFCSEGVAFPLKEEQILIVSLGMEIINAPVMPTGQSDGKTGGKV